jgi:hypothetical protein
MKKKVKCTLVLELISCMLYIFHAIERKSWEFLYHSLDPLN